MRAALALVAAAIVFVFAPRRCVQRRPRWFPTSGRTRSDTNFRWNIYTTDHFEIYYYPEDGTAPRTHRRLRRERVSARQLGPEARPRVQGAAHHLQDEQRVSAAERHPGAAVRKASAHSPSPNATAC